MRFFGKGHTAAFVYVNVCTAIVSLMTAIYLIPLIPSMFSILDESLNKLSNESKESKSKLFTFMAFLCHEIRNPLFAITSSAEFLKDTDLYPEQAEEVSSICDSSLLMLRLVNDVLDLSKLDSGKLELESRKFDLHRLLRRLGENMSRQVDRKHRGAIQMCFDMTHDVPRVIIGDSCRILQIVYNLLSNSCKFTSTGKIELIVRLANEQCEREEAEVARRSGAHTVSMSSDRPVKMLSNEMTGEEDDDEKQLFSMALLDGDVNKDVEMGEVVAPQNDDESIMVLSITVADSGIGIPNERLKNIFEPYTQAKLSDFRQHGGTGLGLSIISSLIKTMGGTISVTSKGGEGSRFHLKIPVRVPFNDTLEEDDDGNHMDGMDSADKIGYGGSGQGDETFLDTRRLPVYEEHQKSRSIDKTGKTIGSDQNSTQQISEMNACYGGGGGLFALPHNANSTNGSRDLLSDPALAPEQAPNRERSSSPSNNRDAPAPSLPPFDFPHNSNVVLVVDDNSVNRKILGKMLTTYKLEYETACNGQEAVDTLLQSRNATGDMSRPYFGLVFMDVSMPVMDGNVAISTIRSHKISVPIVALSANVLSQERDRTICLGADEFHTKPILRTNLHMLCTRFLYRNGHQPPPRRLPNKGGANANNGSDTRSQTGRRLSNASNGVDRTSEIELPEKESQQRDPQGTHPMNPQVGACLV